MMLLLRLLLVWLALFLAVSIWRSRRRRRTRPARPAARKKTTPGSVQTMVACAHCGLMLPEEEALHANGAFWCCPEHLRAGRRA